MKVSLEIPTGLLYDQHAVLNAVPWTPENLMVGGRDVIWYDPSDLDTLKQDAAGTVAVTAHDDPVGYIFDKSPGNFDATRMTDDTTRALYKTDGTLHWLEFDGTNDTYELLTALGFTRNKGIITMIAGVNGGVNASVKYILNASTGTAAGSARAEIRLNSGGGWNTGGRRLDADAFESNSGVDDLEGANHVGSAEINYAAATTFGRVDGVQVLSNSEFQTAGNTEDTDSLSVNFGSSGTPSSFFLGRVYGLIAVNGQLSASELNAAEAYMASKSGVTL